MYEWKRTVLLTFCVIKNRRIKRGGSRGFVLNDDSLDEGFYVESLNQSQNWLEKYENRFANGENHIECACT